MLRQTYFDNSPFCQGYRAGTIQTLVPAPECYDVATSSTGDAQGPPAPFKTTVTDVAPVGFPWWVLLALGGALLVAKR